MCLVFVVLKVLPRMVLLVRFLLALVLEARARRNARWVERESLQFAVDEEVAVDADEAVQVEIAEMFHLNFRLHLVYLF